MWGGIRLCTHSGVRYRGSGLKEFVLRTNGWRTGSWSLRGSGPRGNAVARGMSDRKKGDTGGLFCLDGSREDIARRQRAHLPKHTWLLLLLLVAGGALSLVASTLTLRRTRNNSQRQQHYGHHQGKRLSETETEHAGNLP